MSDASRRDTAEWAKAIRAARSLKSETGENPEYDRALVELLWDMFGGEREHIEQELYTTSDQNGD